MILPSFFDFLSGRDGEGGTPCGGKVVVDGDQFCERPRPVSSCSFRVVGVSFSNVDATSKVVVVSRVVI